MIKHLSASSISTFQTCPKMFKYQYIEKKMPLPSKALDVGKLVHEGIELHNQGKDAIALLKKKILVTMSDENVDTFRIVRRCVSAYIASPVDGKTLGNELSCKFELENSKGEKIDIPLLGLIDRVIEGGVVEYKTTGVDYTQDQVDSSMQASIYAYFFYKMYEKYPDKITYWVVNKSKVMKDKNYLPQILVTTRKPEDTDKLFEEVKQVYNEIKSSNFEAKPGDCCYWCGFRNICNKL